MRGKEQGVCGMVIHTACCAGPVQRLQQATAIVQRHVSCSLHAHEAYKGIADFV